MTPSAPLNRRAGLRGLLAAATLPLLPPGAAHAAPVRGGTLVAVIQPEPPILTTTLNNHYSVNVVSPNVYEGLLSYDEQLVARPALAVGWSVAPDNLSITFRLRQGVTWHDGKPFTAEDVRFSALELWKKLHPRGRATFAHLVAVETPDPHTAIFRLSAPSPIILGALSAVESQVLPAHLYAGTDILRNPHNIRPVGTGPFRFKAWQKGDYIEFERNPDYWEPGKPYLDRLIFRTIPDAASRAAAFENGEVQYGPYDPVPLADLRRLSANPDLAVETAGYAWLSQFLLVEFNLQDPIAGQLAVRQAFAHAIDRQKLIETAWYGLGKAAVGPIPSHLGAFFTAEVPAYPYDPARAEALLDAAGFPRKAGGIRFTLTHDYDAGSEPYQNTAEFLRQNLRQIGVDLRLRTLDVPAMQRRIYTDYDFATRSGQFSSMIDPAMGLYRLYWSKSHVKGVPNTNASGYATPEMDRIIEAAQAEPEPARRIALFHQWQRLAMTDLPVIPLVELAHFTLHNRRVQGLSQTPDAAFAALKNVWLAPAG